MAFKRKRSKYGSKKRTKRVRTRGSFSRRSMVSGRSLGNMGFPRKIRMVHKYTDRNLNTVSTTDFNYSFKANGMFDPNTTGSGGQPLYYDQMVAIYNHYTVIGSRIKVTIVPTGTTVQEPFRVVLLPLDDATSPTNVDTAAQQKGAVYRIAQGGINPDRIIMRSRWSAKKYFGGAVMNNSLLRGSNGVDPTEQTTFHIMAKALDGVSVINFWMGVEIEYIAIWSELKDIALS